MNRKHLDFAVDLLSQQSWCWGRDIARPEGNWLTKLGFERIKPPTHRRDCSSVYTLALPRRRRVVLRGFGLFFGDQRRGGVFLPRYKFQPRYTPCGNLGRPPWTSADLPRMRFPTESQRTNAVSLTLDLLEWIRDYELNIRETLGIDYRRSTLAKWDKNPRPKIQADLMARAWRLLAAVIVEDPDDLVPCLRTVESQPSV